MIYLLTNYKLDITGRCMKILISLFTLFAVSLSSASEWFYYKHYPWIYDHKTKDWLYLSAGNDNKIYAFRNRTDQWEEFNESLQNTNNLKTWDEQYEEWLKDPKPYGGIEVLQLIKRAKDEEVSSIDVGDLLIENIQPFEVLTQLTALGLGDSNITDISPLRNLTKLKLLILKDNTNLQDLSPLTGLTSLEELDFRYNNLIGLDISPILSLSKLQKIRLSSRLISESQINDLQTNLPNCQIAFDEDGHDIVWDLEPDWE